MYYTNNMNLTQNIIRKLSIHYLFAFLIPLYFLSQDNKQNNKMKWWSDSKFGMFIHWGLYSYTAGDWKGKPTKGGEHFMLYERIPLKEYATIAKDFNPTKYNADKWVRLARDAGMKYIVVTAKHHDGFSMYNSSVSDYNIVKKTPYAKDPMVELAKACRKYGLKLCFYYSLGRDWEDPNVPTNWPTKGGRSNTWDYPNEDAKDLSKYIEGKVKPQIRELLSQYGDIGVIWFDTFEMVNKKQSKEIRDLILSIQPNAIINNRIGNGEGDFDVVEQSLISNTRKNWEACITMGANWGYNKHDSIIKSSELLVRNLVEVVSKGGNLLLNIGPRGDGSIPLEFRTRLKSIGRWMTTNSEAIYGTIPWKVIGEKNLEIKELQSDTSMKDAVYDATSKDILPDVRYTFHNNNVYAFVRSPKNSNVILESFSTAKEKIKKVSLLGYPAILKWNQSETGLYLSLPQQIINQEIPVYVYKIELSNKL